MEETEVLTPDTATVETEAPAEPDTAEVEAEGADTEAQTTDTRDFEAELEAARKDAAEEARKSFEAEQVLQDYQARSRQLGAWLSSDAGDQLARSYRYFIEELDSGRQTAAQLLAQIKPENLVNGLAGRVASAIQTREVAATDQLQDMYLAETYKDWRIPQDLQRRKQEAIATGDTVGLYKVRTDIIRRAVLENEVPSEAQKLTAAEVEKNKKASQVAATKAGDTRRAAEEAPTNVSGGGAAGNGMMTSAQIDKIPDSQWMSLPKERRDFLLANRHIADERASKRR